MKKIICTIFLVLICIATVGCTPEKKDSVDLIDFEKGIINVDTSEIENYVKENGYETYLFDFDVDKQIYSCEIHLSEEASSSIVIDGEGYESFVSKARSFLIGGTKIMNTVLANNGISGVSSGMVLVSNEDVVYCVAIDATISYVAHIKSESVPIVDIASDIETLAKTLLGEDLKMDLSVDERRIDIIYHSEKTQEEIDAAYLTIRDVMDNHKISHYALSIYGNDSQPSASSLESEPVVTPTVEVPDSIPYNNVGSFALSSIPVFEIPSSQDMAKADSDLAISTLENKIGNQRYYFYLVDENEKFLGKGSKDGYTPYVYSSYSKISEQPSYMTPFIYYFSKYFSGINCVAYECRDLGKDVFERNCYEYRIEPDENYSIEDYKTMTLAAERICRLVELTLGKSVCVTVSVFPDTGSEIKFVTPDPQIDN